MAGVEQIIFIEHFNRESDQFWTIYSKEHSGQNPCSAKGHPYSQEWEIVVKSKCYGLKGLCYVWWLWGLLLFSWAWFGVSYLQLLYLISLPRDLFCSADCVEVQLKSGGHFQRCLSLSISIIYRFFFCLFCKWQDICKCITKFRYANHDLSK